MPVQRTELVPGKLVWAPERHPAHVGGRQAIDALDLCLHEAKKGSRAGCYEVRHHQQGAWGRAFGPLGLESLLRFCRGLAVKLGSLPPGGGALVLVTPEGDKEYRANAAVLLGAYLMLQNDLSAAGVAACLGEADAGAKFVCPWESAARSARGRVMQVRDCWAGVELAMRQGWLDTGIIKDGKKLSMACAKYNEQLAFSDTTWIIPGMLMVGADPVTVVSHCSSASCRQIAPDYDKGGSSNCTSRSTEGAPSQASSSGSSGISGSSGSSGSGLSVASRGTQTDPIVKHGYQKEDSDDDLDVFTKERRKSQLQAEPDRAETDQAEPERAVWESEDLLDVFTKKQKKLLRVSLEEVVQKRRAERDFTTFLKQSGIGLIIRAGSDGETGSPGGGSYGDHSFEAHGITQASIGVSDKVADKEGGGLPRPADVARMLEVCKGFMKQGSQDAVLVHCEQGFGHSVLLACCLAISRLDVSGPALLGWVRIARPGAVTTRVQELFLTSLKGSMDLLRYVQGPLVDEHYGSVGVSCNNPCHVQ